MDYKVLLTKAKNIDVYCEKIHSFMVYFKGVLKSENVVNFLINRQLFSNKGVSKIQKIPFLSVLSFLCLKPTLGITY